MILFWDTNLNRHQELLIISFLKPFSCSCPVDYLLFTVRDVEVNPNPDEVADIMYVDREKLKELLRKADSGEGGIKLSPWFRLVVDNFMFKWWDHVEKGTLGEVVDMKTIHKLTS